MNFLLHALAVTTVIYAVVELTPWPIETRVRVVVALVTAAALALGYHRDTVMALAAAGLGLAIYDLVVLVIVLADDRKASVLRAVSRRPRG